ncbi:RDD family protein [Nocardiopsis sp. NPDC049922]|uniref:RDD family protein n=1 Tax=Nocardiopsis sp. NPDC049922 TaxID=3155157 RepID=UPI003401D701
MNQPPPDPRWRAHGRGRPYPGPQGPAEPSAPGAPGPEERLYPLASWGARALARVIDLVVVALPVLLLALLLALVFLGARDLFGGSGGVRRYGYFLAVTFFVLYTGYEAFALARWRQTLGKRMAGVRVAPVGGAGRLGAVPAAALTVRAAIFGLPVLLAALPGVPAWPVFVFVALFTGGMAAWDRPNRQGIHDKIAGTVVLDVS